MNSVGDSFAWPFRDPGWLGKIVLQGLIFLIVIIPVIGWIIAPMALYGWQLKSLDNLRQGRQELAPAGFHLSRGLPLWVVEIVYGIVIAGIASILEFVIGGGSPGSGAYVIGRIWNAAAGLFLLFLTPAIILAVDRGGIGAGLNVPALFRTATSNAGASIQAALVILLAGIIAFLGIILCLIGVFFTATWAAAVTAGAVSWFERQIGGAATPASPSPQY